MREYEYRMHPQDAHIVLVRVATAHQHAPHTRQLNWRIYENFQSAESAAIALASLRLAQSRERVRDDTFSHLSTGMVQP